MTDRRSVYSAGAHPGAASPETGPHGGDHVGWPSDPAALEAEQERVAVLARVAPTWRPPPARPLAVAGAFVTLSTAGATPNTHAEGPAWAAAVVVVEGRTIARSVSRRPATSAYRPGYLALQVGALLEEAIRSLPLRPDVLMVNGTGRDHPRRAGVALHLGAILGLPTVGVTDRPLVAAAAPPERRRWSVSPLLLDEEVVGFSVRTRRAVHPVVVHAAWRTDPETALAILRRTVRRARTPEPLRRARQLARTERARDEGRLRA